MNKDIFDIINNWAGANIYLDSIMVFSAHYPIYIMFAVSAGCMAYLVAKKQWHEVLLFFATLALAFGLSLVASKLYISDRPFVDGHVTQLIAHAANQSFPSDHTTAAMTIAFATIAFTRFKKTGWLFLITACLIGFSRIFAGVHYPLDILGGIGAGLIATAVVYLIVRHVSTKQATATRTDS